MTLDTAAADRAVAALGAGDFDSFQELVRGQQHQDGAPIWSHIASAHPSQVNLFDALLTSAEDQERARRSFRYILPAISQLSAASEAEFLKVLKFAGLMGNSFQFSIAQKVAPLMATDAELGSRIGTQLLQGGYPIQALEVWALCFASSAPVQAAKYALALDIADADACVQLARLISNLGARSSEAADLLMTKEAWLVSVMVNSESELERLTWTALDAMSPYSSLATTTLLAGIKAHNQRAISVVSISLYGHSELTYGAADVPVADVLHALVDEALANEASRHDVDEALAYLLGRPALQHIVMAELQRFVQKDIDMYGSFKSTTQTLHGDATLLSQLVTAWLFSDGFRIEPLRTLLAPIGSMGADVSLDVARFISESDAARGKALNRLVLSVHSGEILLGYVKTFLETEPVQPHCVGFGARLLEFTWKEYPGTSQRFVEARLKEVQRTSEAANLYRPIHQAGKNWDARLAALPPRKELMPTTAESLALRAMRMKRSRQISRLSDEGSVLADLFSKSHVAQGHSFVVEMGDGSEALTQMHGMSVSMEMPFSETADPVGAFLGRIDMLKAAY